VLLLVLSPHLGILLMSLSRVWSFSVLPEGFTLAHYATVFAQSKGMIVNTLVYCGAAALIDVVLGAAIAYLILRTRLPGRQLLDLARRRRWPSPAWCWQSATCAPSAASSCRSCRPRSLPAPSPW
jgi:ABC-type sugar transport system permease subunit